MMTAQEARDTADKVQLDNRLSFYFDMIKEEAEKGNYSVLSKVTYKAQLPTKEVIDRLLSLGYDVATCWYNDFNEGEYLIIWK